METYDYVAFERAGDKLEDSYHRHYRLWWWFYTFFNRPSLVGVHMRNFRVFRRPGLTEVLNHLDDLQEAIILVPKTNRVQVGLLRDYEAHLDHLRRYDSGMTFRAYKKWFGEYQEGKR